MKDKITVLIADDNTEFANTLSRYLEDEEDMSVIGIARDGEEAFKMIQGTHPDICLLDVIMPHVDGLGVLEKINEANMVKRPMCIMLSAVGRCGKKQHPCGGGCLYREQEIEEISSGKLCLLAG